MDNVKVPADPVHKKYEYNRCAVLSNQPQDLTDHKRLTLHTEIKVLQASLSITYKDAAHRLYMAEVTKLNISKRAYKAFEAVRLHAESALGNGELHSEVGEGEGGLEEKANPTKHPL